MHGRAIKAAAWTGLLPLVSLLALSSSDPPYAAHLRTKIASGVAKSERRARERSSAPRATCSGCGRPPVLCVCDALPSSRVATSTEVLVLQHPREFRRRSLSTVPLLPLVLERCAVKVGYGFAPEDLEAVAERRKRGEKPLLLFPGPAAHSLDAEEKGGGRVPEAEEGNLLVLIDGTWAEARRMMMQSPELVEACRQVQLVSDRASLYDDVRKEPEKHCTSTLEACARALQFLEPDARLADHAGKCLEGAMRHMVEKKRRVSTERNQEPRFTRPGAKSYAKNKRWVEIKKELFVEDPSET